MSQERVLVNEGLLASKFTQVLTTMVGKEPSGVGLFLDIKIKIQDSRVALECLLTTRHLTWIWFEGNKWTVFSICNTGKACI
jgi:hypothetical protein